MNWARGITRQKRNAHKYDRDKYVEARQRRGKQDKNPLTCWRREKEREKVSSAVLSNIMNGALWVCSEDDASCSAVALKVETHCFFLCSTTTATQANSTSCYEFSRRMILKIIFNLSHLFSSLTSFAVCSSVRSRSVHIIIFVFSPQQWRKAFFFLEGELAFCARESLTGSVALFLTLTLSLGGLETSTATNFCNIFRPFVTKAVKELS